MQWNDAQIRAIQVNKGPALILAGPGSGKTTVIVHRVQNLIRSYGVSPENILVLTFTRAAAAQMRQRAVQLFGKDAEGVTYGTFHSVFYRILKQEWNISEDRVITQEKKMELLRQITALIPRGLSDGQLKKLEEEIGLLRRRTAEGKSLSSELLTEQELRFVFDVYVGWLRRYDMVDYDEMIDRTKDLLLGNEKSRLAWRERYKYILVDEFQDIDRQQYELVRLLAHPADNLFVVGDDDQSIYGFRGAGTGIVQDFAKDYPKAARVLLAQNYRSTPQILYAAGQVIQNNRKRFAKKLVTKNPDGPRVQIRIYEDAAGEAIGMAAEIKKMLQAGVPSREIAVLVRVNAQKKSLALALKKAGIEVQEEEEEREEGGQGAAAKPGQDKSRSAAAKSAGEENAQDADRSGIRLLTMHGAKGLEFDKVFLPNVCEGLNPYRRAKTGEEIEEERRLFYVAMTRAKTGLVISWPKNMWNRSQEASRFIREMTD
ncbi:MAG: ATP-dependent helicase [Lachnospiraceae bacterium]|nr:ATP-dependent helicase [Lachnospiraceae bacterium]